MSKPDYCLKILNKETDEKCNHAGVAWINDNNSITIVLSPCVSLVSDKKYVFNLFPIENKENKI